MTDFFDIQLNDDELRQFSNLALAHVGDCVFELLVRTHLLLSGSGTNRRIHEATMDFVTAPAQARAMEKLLPLLTEEELTVYKRGRNSHVNSVPKHADLGDYHAATGLECLFGWLWLRGERRRLTELFSRITEETPQKDDQM